MKLPPQPVVPRGRIRAVMRRLARAIDGLEEPAIEKIAEDQQEDPFQVLIATMLSAQTKDAVTHAASTRLFRVARTPRTMAKLRVKEIERLIYPVSFYRNKAVHVQRTCEEILSVTLASCPRPGRAPDPAWRRTQDREPRADSCPPQRGQHLRRYARAPHFKPSRLGRDTDTGRNRTSALRGGGPPVVADHQLVPRHVGPERMPARVSSLRRVLGTFVRKSGSTRVERTP